MNEFYTYAYLRKDGSPYYIGKGKGKRAYCNNRRQFRCPKDKKQVLILKRNLTEVQAFKHEIYMIAVLGRKDLGTGPLRNRTDGGEGCVRLIFTPNHIANLKRSAKMKPPKSKRAIKLMKQALTGRKQSTEHAANNGRAHRKGITLVHTQTNETRTFHSGKEASKELGLHAPSISALRKGKLKTHKGWRIKNDNQ